MAKTTLTTDDIATVNPADVNDAANTVDDGWENITVGLGHEHNPEETGTPLQGTYLGYVTKEVEDKQNGGMRPTNAYRFTNSDGEIIFMWGSYEIDEAMNTISEGDTVRISFLGRDTFTGDKGPQTVKNYKVQVKRTPVNT